MPSPRLQNLIDRLHAGEMLLGDGAWSTQLQQLGLQAGDCPEEWNVSRPEVVKKIARDYFVAGADFCLTNTFSANKFRLQRQGFAEQVAAFNRAGARLSREAAEEFGRVAAGSVGPTGEFIQPEGLASEREVLDAFRAQTAALKDGGVDAICIETMYVPEEAALAVKAARELGLFCMASVTFDSTPKGFRTMLGKTVAETAALLDAAGADVIGTNCGNGSREIAQIARELRAATQKPLIVKPNAYSETPEFMAAHLRELKLIGVNIVGGCCGTTPEHIRAFRTEIDRIKNEK